MTLDEYYSLRMRITDLVIIQSLDFQLNLQLNLRQQKMNAGGVF